MEALDNEFDASEYVEQNIHGSFLTRGDQKVMDAFLKRLDRSDMLFWSALSLLVARSLENGLSMQRLQKHHRKPDVLH
jgi:hypothetical protein